MAGLWNWAFPKRSNLPAQDHASTTPMSATAPPASPNDNHALKPFISRALDSALTQAEAEEAFDIIMSGGATASQIGGFLMIIGTIIAAWSTPSQREATYVLKQPALTPVTQI